MTLGPSAQPQPSHGPLCTCSPPAPHLDPQCQDHPAFSPASPSSPPPQAQACRSRAETHLGDQDPTSRHGSPLPSPQVIIHRLLSMFHPRPFVKTRFAPQGAVACLTAISDFYYTVMFRCVVLRDPSWSLCPAGDPGEARKGTAPRGQGLPGGPQCHRVPPSGLGRAVLALWASVSSSVAGGGGDFLLGTRGKRGACVA